MGLLDHLSCGRCHSSHDPDEIQSTCRECGGPLLSNYRLESGGPSLREVLDRPPGQNRLYELAPTRAGPDTPSLGEGATPLVPAPRLGAALGLDDLRIKDETQNPTLSFKARGMAAAVARAAELGVRTVCLPTAGNAGGAAAAYGARHGLDVHVHLPRSTPAAIVEETEALGAHVTRVDGTIADAGRIQAELAREKAWFSLATLREPYRIEGKKVMGFELLYDLGRLPDVVVYPTGGGTGLIGMWKAFDEMQALGWIGSDRPRMISVQVAGCAPIVRAFEAGEERAAPWEEPEPTSAYGLRVPAALGDFLILRALRASGGTAIAIDESEMIAATGELARGSGLQGATEGGACLAATRRLVASGAIAPHETVVLFNTGHALKYL